MRAAEADALLAERDALPCMYGSRLSWHAPLEYMRGSRLHACGSRHAIKFHVEDPLERLGTQNLVHCMMQIRRLRSDVQALVLKEKA